MSSSYTSTQPFFFKFTGLTRMRLDASFAESAVDAFEAMLNAEPRLVHHLSSDFEQAVRDAQSAQAQEPRAGISSQSFEGWTLKDGFRIGITDHGNDLLHHQYGRLKPGILSAFGNILGTQRSDAIRFLKHTVEDSIAATRRIPPMARTKI